MIATGVAPTWKWIERIERIATGVAPTWKRIAASAAPTEWLTP